MHHTSVRSLQTKRLSFCFSEVSSLFSEPISIAAKELGVSESHLKRQCRKMGIKRWPQRKLRALNDCLRKLQQLKQTPENVRNVACLEEQRDELYRRPSKIHKKE